MSRLIGFSTGAIANGDFSKALELLRHHDFNAIELSALRFHEVTPLMASLDSIDLTSYKHVAFHAPSSYAAHEEAGLIDLLNKLPKTWPIVVHPDAIFNFDLWRRLGRRVAIENMDKRKAIGRTKLELAKIFTMLPDASMCFDIGHARQFDASMLEAFLILKAFKDRVVQIHVSEVDALNKHERISFAAEIAFRQLAPFIPPSIALILESSVKESEISNEAIKALSIFSPKENALGTIFEGASNVSGLGIPQF